MKTIEITQTTLPCGNECGIFYMIPRLVLPAEIQSAAVQDGWGILEVDGRPVLACKSCLKNAQDTLRESV